MITDVEKMLMKQFLLRVRQEGYSIVENPPRHLGGINIDIYRGKTKICTFDDRSLGDWGLQLTTHDSTAESIKHDYNKLFYLFIGLRDLYMIYSAAVPLQGYDHSLGFRTILEYGHCTLAVKSNQLGELEFGTFITGKHNNGYSTHKTILHNVYFDMNNYSAAKLDFVARSGLLMPEQLITRDNIKYLHGACVKTMDKEGALFKEDTRNTFQKVIVDLEKVQDAIRDIDYRASEISAPTALYIETKIMGVKGIFTNNHIDRATIPKNLYAYNIQFSDDLKPASVWDCNNLVGRKFGTVITKKPLIIDEKGYTEFKEKDFILNPEMHLTLRNFHDRREPNDKKRHTPER